jgi:hypothetical protein
MGPDQIDIRFWPFKVTIRGDRTIAALRWPLAIALMILALTLGGTVILRLLDFV